MAFYHSLRRMVVKKFHWYAAHCIDNAKRNTYNCARRASNYAQIKPEQNEQKGASN
ncbi:hypothetical protein ccbrp13_50080 [Ktedonobacteria bacterium brp13]|nr:hypothetical protein ccbrp13_50080 [Ktedonobacteria bacterium brp13]